MDALRKRMSKDDRYVTAIKECELRMSGCNDEHACNISEEN